MAVVLTEGKGKSQQYWEAYISSPMNYWYRYQTSVVSVNIWKILVFVAQLIRYTICIYTAWY